MIWEHDNLASDLATLRRMDTDGRAKELARNLRRSVDPIKIAARVVDEMIAELEGP
ncbi:MAG: hypothetical protein P1S46_06265 [bacterium]|nr:hypothetical protein [bacterium]